MKPWTTWSALSRRLGYRPPEVSSSLNYPMIHKITTLQTEWLFLLWIKMSVWEMTVVSLPKMIPKLHPSCAQRLWVLLSTTSAGTFRVWTMFIWLMEQLRLPLRHWTVRLSHTADLYLKLWPGDSTANGPWNSPSGLGRWKQLQVILPHYSLKYINPTGLLFI